MPASNTRDAIRALIGRKIVGVLFDALPVNRADLRKGNKTLVFEDGSGFTFNSNGSYWLEKAGDVERAIKTTQAQLRTMQEDLRGVLELAGALPSATSNPSATEEGS